MSELTENDVHLGIEELKSAGRACGIRNAWMDDLLDAVEARAARRERARIADAVRARRDRLGDDAEGHRAAYEIVLADLGAGDDDTR